VKIHSCLKILFFIILFAPSCLGQPNDSKQPAVISAACPVFPPIAAAANAVGEAIVDVDVDAAGHVNEVIMVRVHPLLREAVDRAARKWQFERASGGPGGGLLGLLLSSGSCLRARLPRSARRHSCRLTR
jgi:hypothetical protein